MLGEVSESKGKVERKQDFTESDVSQLNSNSTSKGKKPREYMEPAKVARFIKRAAIKKAQDIHRSSTLYLKVEWF